MFPHFKSCLPPLPAIASLMPQCMLSPLLIHNNIPLFNESKLTPNSSLQKLPAFPPCHCITDDASAASPLLLHNNQPLLINSPRPTTMVCRLTNAATKDLRDKIARGKRNLNIQTAAYLCDIVSGEHFPDYKAPPPNGHQTAIVQFHQLFRYIQLEQDLQGNQLAERGGEEGKNILVIISLAVLCICIYPVLCICVYPCIKLSCRREHRQHWQR
jgi:hypothetical protein